MHLTLCLLILCSSSLAFLWVNQGIFAIHTLHICAVHIFHVCCIPHICTDLHLLSSYTLKFNNLHTGFIMEVYCAGTPCVYTGARVAGNLLSLEKLFLGNRRCRHRALVECEYILECIGCRLVLTEVEVCIVE